MTSLAKRYISFAEVAGLCPIKLSTLYAWAADRKIGAAQGVYQVGRRWAVDWDVFRAKVIESGDF